MSWGDEQHFESDWWGDCTNTFGEELKHPTYARLMGLEFRQDGGRIALDQSSRSVLDIGGGPASMLLKTRGARRRTVVDPCDYPAWTRERYAAAGIEVVQMPAEDFVADEVYDEVWCYNVLEHVRDPRAVIGVMLRSARVLRICEWVNEPPHPGHPHELRSETLRSWIGDLDGYFAEHDVVWDLWYGGNYQQQPAFHGYGETGR